MKKESPKDSIEYIFGRHAVLEVLNMRPDIVEELFLERDHQSSVSICKKHDIGVKPLNGKRLPGGLSSNAVHQGFIASVDISKLTVPYKAFIKDFEVTSKTSFMIFGEVQDPHNVGAVIRSSAAFGVSGVLIPPHNQAPVNGTVIKVSAGMAFKIPLVTISNVNSTIRDLKERGFWVYGLEGDGETGLPDESFERPSVFVLGNEAAGLREKTKEVCDTLLSIPIDPRCESLNASASAATVLYAWSVRKVEK